MKLVEKVGINIIDVGLGNGLLYTTPKAQALYLN